MTTSQLVIKVVAKHESETTEQVDTSFLLGTAERAVREIFARLHGFSSDLTITYEKTIESTRPNRKMCFNHTSDCVAVCPDPCPNYVCVVSVVKGD